MNGSEMHEKFGLISRVNIPTRIMLRLLIYSAGNTPPFTPIHPHPHHLLS